MEIKLEVGIISSTDNPCAIYKINVVKKYAHSDKISRNWA